MSRKTKSSTLHNFVAVFSIGALLITILLVIISSSSINKQGFTLLNKAAGMDASVVNRWGNAAVFDGYTGYISVNNSENFNPQLGFTAETWFKPHFDPGIIDRTETLINKINLNNESFLLHFNISSTDGVNYNLSYFFTVNNPANNCQSDWTITTNRTTTYDDAISWQHIAGVIQNDGKLDLFVNGKREENSVGRVTATCSTAAPYRIGALSFGLRRGYFDGQMDEIRVSNVARYGQTFTPMLLPFIADSHTLFLYHLDEKTGVKSVYDSSTNHRNGTIQNLVTFATSSVPSPLAVINK